MRRTGASGGRAVPLYVALYTPCRAYINLFYRTKSNKFYFGIFNSLLLNWILVFYSGKQTIHRPFEAVLRARALFVNTSSGGPGVARLT